MKGDRMQLLTHKAKLHICFYLPAAAKNFIRGLFMNQQIEIGDKISRAGFYVAQIECVPEEFNFEKNDTILLQPLSPLVAGIKNDKGIYTYLNPRQPEYTTSLVYNWIQKYNAIYNANDIEIEKLKDKIRLRVLLFSTPPQSRLISIKAGSPEETKIRGFKKFRIEVKASQELLEIALGAGMGLYIAQGMGCVEMVGD